MSTVKDLFMSTNQENVLVLGACGVVGFGVCHAWLHDNVNSNNVHVYAVDRDEAALRQLSTKLDLDEAAKARLHCIVGDLSTQATGEHCKAAVLEALNKSGGADNKLKHVVSAIRYTTPDMQGSVSSANCLKVIQEAYQQALFPNFMATSMFLNLIEDVEGASYTVAGGPYAHHCPHDALYNTSLVSGTLNHYGTILKSHTANKACRGNTLCCHYAIGYPDDVAAGEPSSFGRDLLDKDFGDGKAEDCRNWGAAFVRLARGPERLGCICMHDPPEVATLVASREWAWDPEARKYGPMETTPTMEQEESPKKKNKRKRKRKGNNDAIYAHFIDLGHNFVYPNSQHETTNEAVICMHCDAAYKERQQKMKEPGRHSAVDGDGAPPKVRKKDGRDCRNHLKNCDYLADDVKVDLGLKPPPPPANQSNITEAAPTGG